MRFVLDDPLDHPFYGWPRTLLSYPVRFDEPINLLQLVLRNEQGAIEPFQWSGVRMEGTRLRAATLNLFSDLPPGGHRAFTLERGDPQLTPRMFKGQEQGIITVDMGSLHVNIPATQTVRGVAPGPVLAIFPYGNFTFEVTGDTITRIDTEELGYGNLFVAYRLTYHLASGGVYIATVVASKVMILFR